MSMQKRKFKWNYNWNFPPSSIVKDAAQVAILLHTASCSSPKARFVEYCRGNTDLEKVQDFLEVNSGFDHVLGEHRGYGAFTQWQKRLPGFWDCSQDTTFAFCRPEDPVSKLSHSKMEILKRSISQSFRSHC